MIKIVSGLSIPVGSTVALVNLCNQLNDRGYHCVLYGPDHWHMEQCRSAMLADFRLEDEDVLIVHRIKLFSAGELNGMENRIGKLRETTVFDFLKSAFARLLPGSKGRSCRKLILSCQENDGFPIRRLNYALFDKIHYVHRSQIAFHNVVHNHFVCPNFYGHLTASENKPVKVAGVIGSIRPENRTDECVEKALRDGMDTVMLYGHLIDPVYYYRRILPLSKKYPGRIKFAGFVDDKQKIYDSVSDVYCVSEKTGGLVERECMLTGTRYHGPGIPSSEGDPMTNDQIYEVWKRELGL